MKSIRSLSLILALGLLAGSSLDAQTVLVDFQNVATPSQPGSSVFNRNTSWGSAGESDARNFTLGSDTITITLTAAAAGSSGFERPDTNTAFTDFAFRPLYRDGIQRLRSSTSLAALTISGLEPAGSGLTYGVRIWWYDPGFENNSVQSYYNVTGGATPVTPFGTITNNTIASGNASFPDNTAYSVFGTFAAHTDGTLAFAITGPSSNARISGLEIQVIPEPSSLALLIGAAGAAGVIRMLRRRRNAV